MSQTNPSDASPQAAPPLRVRYRVRFAKRDLLRWISHRDLARLWERLVRRARLPLSMTEGFHPKPRIAFPSALALGVESHDEVVELELTEDYRADRLLKILAADHQPGLTIHSVHRLPDRFGKAQLQRSDYSVSLVEDFDRNGLVRAIEKLRATETVSIERKKKTVVVHVPSQILRLHLGEDCLLISLAASDAASLRPTDVLELLGIGDWIERGASVVRERVVLEREFNSDDPEVAAVAHNTQQVAVPKPEQQTDVSETREAS